MRTLLYSFLLSLVVIGCSAQKAEPPQAKIQKVNFAIDGMVCSSCEESIQTKLVKLEGVKSVEASTAKKCAIVEFDASKVSEKDLIATIESLGYKAVAQSQSATN
ncbi:MAG: heavy-metal-associated domain-containing protein [Candidatus Thermochlorobacter sp.]